MKNRMIIALLLAGTLSWGSAGELRVRDARELKNALETANAGTVVLVADGTYDLGSVIELKNSGTASSPIVLRAENRGKAEFVGESRFQLLGISHFVIEGFVFSGSVGPAIDLRGCQFVRISRNVFHLKETQRSSWVMIDGWKEDTTRLSGHNRVDHNLFENKSLLGNFITLEGTRASTAQVSQFDRIDHNHFRDIGPRVENVLEAIRVGSADFTLSNGYTVLERNLFERCDGDPEYISIKSSRDTIRGNTFRECLGSLSLRHGNGSVVEGNFILGNGRTGTFLDSTGKRWTLGTGGLRFCGNDMRIEDNYLEGLTGREWDATFAIIGGNAEYGDGQSLTKHFRIRNAVIARNILVNNVSGFEIGYNGGGFQGNWWPMAAVGVTFADNIVVGKTDTLIKLYNPPVNSVWKNNIAWPTENAVVSASTIEGVRVVDPKLHQRGGIWTVDDRPRRPLTSTDVGPNAP